jgi:hypothetical protein
MSGKLYDNCQCLSQEGEHMFYCNKKKAQSYLKKGIAKLISEDPYVFQLTFEPGGKGAPQQTPRENKCVVCGTEEDLTKHHVIPYAFRKLMPPHLKDHRSEEIVPLCVEHHREYEVSSRELMLKLLENCKEEINSRALAIKAIKSSHALSNYYDHLDEKKRNEYRRLLKYMNYKIYSDQEILMLKYGYDQIIVFWKDDFLSWMKKKGIDDFHLKK